MEPCHGPSHKDAPIRLFVSGRLGPAFGVDHRRNTPFPENSASRLQFRSYGFSSASIATCEMASSTSLGAPLHAIAPIVFPSTLMGSPPRLGNPSGKARMATFPFFNESSAAPEGCP